MQIHSLELNDFMGVSHLRLEDLPDRGVVVIHGNNEAGKSTLLTAIDAVLNEKYSSRKKSIRALEPAGPVRDAGNGPKRAGAGGPEVIIEMTVGPYRFRLSKQWLKSASAELSITEPSPEHHTNDDAEARLRGVLDAHLDEKLLDTLFLRQGSEFDARIQAAGIPSLSTALDARSGSTAAGEAQAENDALMERVEAEYSRYYTKKEGKPAKELKQAQQELDSARADARAAEEKFRQLESYVDRYEDLDRQQRDVEEKLPAAQADLAQRTEELERASAAAEMEERLRDAFERAQLEADRLRQTRIERDEIAAQVDELSADATTARAEVEEKLKAAAEEDERITELTRVLEDAKNTHASAREGVRVARRASTLAADAERLHTLGDFLDEVDSLDARVTQAREKVAACRRLVTDADVTDVEEAANEVRMQRALAEAAAAKLRLDATEREEITVDGEVLVVGDEPGEPRVVELSEGTTLRIGNVTASYAAGTGGTGQHATGDKLAAAQSRLNDLLNELDCADVQQVRARRDEHRQLVQDRDNAVREWDSTVGDRDIGELRAQYAALKGTLADVDVPEASAEELAERLRVAEGAEEDAQRAVEDADALLAPRRERPASRDAIVARTNSENVASLLRSKQEELAKAQAALSTEDLAAQVEQAAATAEGAKTAWEAARAEVEKTNPEMVQKLVEGAEAQVNTYTKRKDEATSERKRLSGLIEYAMGAAESVEVAQARQRAAEEVFTAVERRAQAARRLRDTLLEHRDAARRRYAAPFARTLSSFATTVFGGKVDFVLDDDLSIVERTRDGVSVPLSALSGGAKEQLAILTRFAIADLVTDTHNDSETQTVSKSSESVPVVVDDALGSTDPQRLQLMSTLFADAGKNSQVLVFTCDPDRFSRIPNRQEIDIEAAKMGSF